MGGIKFVRTFMPEHKPCTEKLRQRFAKGGRRRVSRKANKIRISTASESKGTQLREKPYDGDGDPGWQNQSTRTSQRALGEILQGDRGITSSSILDGTERVGETGDYEEYGGSSSDGSDES